MRGACRGRGEGNWRRIWSTGLRVAILPVGESKYPLLGEDPRWVVRSALRVGGVESGYLYGRHLWMGCCRSMEDSACRGMLGSFAP